jgi:hypothetical protein
MSMANLSQSHFLKEVNRNIGFNPISRGNCHTDSSKEKSRNWEVGV